jgi:hypothetical protein
MTPIHPFKVIVYNRITGTHFAEYRANQVPAKGDQISVFATSRNEEDPFDLWGLWVVDQVVWRVASPGSVAALAIARESGGYLTDAACDTAEVHVWPAQGPHWAETPRFAKVLDPDEADEGGAA